MTTVTNKNGVTFNIDDIVTDLNGKMDRDGLNASASICVESWHSGSNWYRVYSDGYCEQGGVLENANGADITISFLKAFADTNYYIAKTYEGPYTGTWMATYERFYDKTSANIKTYGGSGTDKYCWYACGYIS